MFTSIVVGTDGSDTASAAVRRAAAVAKGFAASLHVVSAYGLPDATPEAELDLPDLDDWKSQLQAEVEAMLAKVSRELHAEGVKVETHALPGHPVHAIIDVAQAVGADLVVVGNKGMQGAKRILGSVPNGIAHRAPCDVLIAFTTELAEQPRRPDS